MLLPHTPSPSPTNQRNRPPNYRGAAEVVKFIYLYYFPSNVPLSRKRNMGKFEGAIKKLLGSVHTSLEIESPSELTDDVIDDLIARVTQRKDMNTDRSAASFVIGGVAVQAMDNQSAAKAAMRKADTLATSFAGKAQGYAVDVQDEDALRAAIADVRNDKSDTDWVLAGYEDKKTVKLIGSGSGGLDALLEACVDKSICYGLFRVTETIDRTTAVKFVFVNWVPEDVPVMLKAVVSTHKGTVQPIFRPWHADFTIAARDEISMDSVMDEVMRLSGTKSMVSDRKEERKVDTYQRKFVGGVSAEQAVGLEFAGGEEGEEAIRAAIKEVRNDSSDVEWLVAALETEGKKESLALLSTGSGGMDAFRAALVDEGRMSYGLLRLTQTIDKTTAVKFLFVAYQGKKIPAWLKAKVGTLRGAVVKVFHPFHADLFADSPGDVTNDALLDRIGGSVANKANW